MYWYLKCCKYNLHPHQSDLTIPTVIPCENNPPELPEYDGLPVVPSGNENHIQYLTAFFQSIKKEAQTPAGEKTTSMSRGELL